MVIIIVLGLFFLGIILGFIVRDKPIVLKITDKTSVFFVCLLLLLLGISVGSNHEIMQNLSGIGLKAIIITVLTLACSVLVSYLIFINFFKHKKKK